MITKKPKSSKLKIDLTGPNGNAFYLLGVAQQLASKNGLNSGAIVGEMMNGDYEHLVHTFDKYFGKFVVLYR